MPRTRPMPTDDEIRHLALDECFPDSDGLVRAIVNLALDDEPIDLTRYNHAIRRECGTWEQGDALLWCEETIRVRHRMALREEV